MAASIRVAPTVEVLQPARWSPALRIGFRFCFVYLGLFCLLSQTMVSFFAISPDDIPDPGTLWPFRQIVFRTALHVFGREAPLSFRGNSSSGDDLFGWVTHFCMLVFAALAAVAWSLLDRRRDNYAGLDKWFRVLIRFSLAGQMLQYGFAKVFPAQMPFPALTRFVEPFGAFSPMGVLWSSIGASQPYEIFAGCAEVLGGILLILPRTATLGAIICMADMTQVFMLNMTYDVPVKVFSFHLLLMSLFLFAPEAPRMAAFLSGDRNVGPSLRAELFPANRANRIALAAQVVFGAWLVGLSAHIGFTMWREYGSARTLPPLYGIWNVDELVIDGQVRPPLLTDSGRWRRVVVDYPERIALQRMDDSFVRFGAAVSIKDKTVVLSKSSDRNWHAGFRFDRPAGSGMSLDGEMDNHRVHMHLQLVDRGGFLLVNRGFHWIQETPFNW
jgi:uncharacterized membrane protein YphA (DoxX/SURF4 family)